MEQPVLPEMEQGGLIPNGGYRAISCCQHRILPVTMQDKWTQQAVCDAACWDLAST